VVLQAKNEMKPISQGARIHITGIVQGVGFRPFVYNTAIRMGLLGWVRNTAAGVDIEVDGTGEIVESFVQSIQSEAPPLARIDSIEVMNGPAKGFSSFEIVHSESRPDDFIPISPDVSICTDCLRELFDPTDRRYRYPFINCTNCGPRYTIIESIPYDRPNTTMKGFPLCPDCAAEYHDPSNRRFHAQPVACPVCGPQVWLEMRDDKTHRSSDSAITNTQRLLSSGKILAIKGLGGFHLACDATNQQAVTELRCRKLRVDKAFAVMLSNADCVAQHCFLNPAERQLLESRQRPIVILRRKPESTIAAEVAPGQDTIGVMLPYTPLHYLLLANTSPLVMTSGNVSEEPIATDNEEARQRLSALCDGFLMHDRPIRTRCDDSVARLYARDDQKSSVQFSFPTLIIRRARGYAPESLHLPFEAKPILATGPELKNTFCLARGQHAFLSQHIGDLENYETLQSFEDSIQHLEALFRIKPEAIVYDLHPNYLATRYALERAEREMIPAIGTQHHHAHIAACMADYGLDGSEPVIGVAFDGTGYGTDGHIWGSEFLIANYDGFKRVGHLRYFPLPGGDAATREPWRTALALLWQAGIDWDEAVEILTYSNSSEDLKTQARILQQAPAIHHQLDKQINTPFTSSMGRLFDAVAALTGVRQIVNYEAQAAIELEALVDEHETGSYPIEIKQEPNHSEPGKVSDIPNTIDSTILNPAPLLDAVFSDTKKHTPAPIIAARFHNGITEAIRQAVIIIRDQTGVNQIALSGGVWQNITLLTKTITVLQAHDFSILTHRMVPPNDGGVALGQIVIGLRNLPK